MTRTNMSRSTIFKLTEDLNKICKTHLKMFKKLEWQGVRDGPSDRMGDEGVEVDCCLFCAGVRPDHRFACGFTKSAIGHQPNCELVKAMEQCEKMLGV